MKLFKIFLTVMTLVLMASFSQAGNGVKGGEDLSPEFVSVVRSLPQLITGMSAFAAIDPVAFQKAVSDPAYRVEMQYGLAVNGAPKAAVTDPDLKTTYLNPDFWIAYNFMSDGPTRKEVLALHEILVVMKIETNDDYTYSNRLYARGAPASDKLIVSVGRITPMDVNSSGIINAVNYNDGTSIFYTCSDRKNQDTCKTLGRLDHYYSQQDFISLHLQLLKQYKRWKLVTRWGAATLAGVGAAVGAVVGRGEGSYDPTALPSAMFGIGASGAILGGIFLNGVLQQAQVDTVKEMVALTSPQLLQGGSFNLDYSIGNFQQLLQWTN